MSPPGALTAEPLPAPMVTDPPSVLPSPAWSDNAPPSALVDKPADSDMLPPISSPLPTDREMLPADPLAESPVSMLIEPVFGKEEDEPVAREIDPLSPDDPAALDETVTLPLKS